MNLAVIGNFKNQRAFKLTSINALPIRNYSQKSAWMSSGISKTYFEE